MTKRSILTLAALFVAMALALTVTTTRAPAQETQIVNDDVQVVRVYFDDELTFFQIAGEYDVWEADLEKKFFVTDATAADQAAFAALGMRVELDAELTESVQRVRDGYLPGQGGGIPGYPCYRTVEETFDTAEDIVAAYPDLAQWIDAGDSWEKSVNALDGYDMNVLRLTNFNFGDPDAKPKLMITTAIHAREYTTAELATRFAEFLVANYGVDPDVTWILDYQDIHLMLHSNPDGRKYAEAGQLWRKNTNQNYCGAGSSSRGADLNRNFPFLWGCCGGSSGSQCSETYRGPSPSSEPETQAITTYGASIFPDQREDDLTAPAPDDATGLYLDIHSYSELVLWPWGFTNTVAPNGIDLQTLGRKFAYFNDYLPEQAIGLYPTDGTTDDYFYGELGVASYTFELGTSFFQSCSTFENTIYPDNLPALIYAAKVAGAPYQLPAGPEALNVTVTPAAATFGQLVTINATLDDTRFSANLGVEPSQNIVAAKAYIDIPPWEPGAVGYTLNPVDGAFDSPVEEVTRTGPARLSQGRHIVYIQGEDAAGNKGPVTSAFAYIIDPATSPKIEGTVTNAANNGPIAATVTAGNSFSASTNPNTGFYSMYVIAGTYDVTASANNFGAQTATVTAVDGQTTVQNFSLERRCVIGRDKVERGNIGWTVQAPWDITNETSYSPTHSWTDSPGTNYGNNRNVAITSPTVNLTGYTDISLSFAQICDTEAGYDYCRVEISTNGGTSWSEIATYDGNSTEWEVVELSVPELDNQANVKVRFRLTTDFTVTDDGWHLDDLTLKGAGAACNAQTPINVFDVAGDAGN